MENSSISERLAKYKADQLKEKKIREAEERKKPTASGSTGNQNQPPPEKKTMTKPVPKNKYADVHDVILSLKHKAKIWDDNHIQHLKIYKVLQLGDDEAVTYGKAMFYWLNQGLVNANVLVLMLRLAVSLRGLTSNGAILTAPDALVNAPSTLSDPDTDYNQSEEGNGLDEAALAALRKRKKDAELKVKENVDKASGDVKKESDGADEDKAAQAAAYCFAAAYLLRLQCRQADKTHENIKSMKARFAGFYDEGTATLETLDVTVATLDAVRDLIARRPEIISTWVLWLAVNENTNTSLSTQEFGMLVYIGLQVFSYQGMHAVTQVLALKQLSKMPLDKLLTQLNCQMTRSAVDEIYKIVRDHEITTRHPERTTFFRYARVWSPGYFMDVQSKECPQLVYLVAKTLKAISPNLKSDPTKIYACQELGEAMKEKLDSVSRNLVSYILESLMADEESGSIWDTTEGK